MALLTLIFEPWTHVAAVRKEATVGEYTRMKRYLTFAGILYAGVGTFLALAVYFRGNDSAYTSNQNWSDALVVGLTWPWQVLQHLGFVA